MSSTRPAPAWLAVLCMLAATAACAETPHLTLDDIDQLSRNKVVRSLTDTPSPSIQPAASQPAPVAIASPPDPVKPATPREPAHARSRAEPVTFVGAFHDSGGASVLYEFEGAVYAARVGTKLLNGWTTRKVDGFLVTVADGRSTWAEPLKGGGEAPPVTGGPLQALNDLNGPLPPGGIGNGTQVIVPFGR